jgi:DNA-binding transcriptional LysR family regulator
MRFNKLDLNLLVALDALLAECSITRAAERLHMSASAMSSALARLREYFDDDLLVQVGRKMEITPRAEVLRDAVRDVLMRIDAGVAAQPQFDPAQTEREFRISVSDYSQATLAPHALALAWRQAPMLRFNFVPQVDNPQRALERGEVDLLVIPQGMGSEHHPTETLFNERFTCVVWSGSALARQPLSFEAYTAAGHVVMQPVTPGGGGYSFETWFMQRYGVTRRVDVHTYSFIAAVQLVPGTDRIATVHHRLALQLQRMLPITLLDPPFPMTEMQQSMQWHKYRSHDPAIVWLRRLFHDAVKTMDAQ